MVRSASGKEHSFPFYQGELLSLIIYCVLYWSYLCSGPQRQSLPKYQLLVKPGREERPAVIRYTGHFAPWGEGGGGMDYFASLC